VPRALVEAWRYRKPDGEERPIKYQKDGLVHDIIGMDGIFLLSDATARALVELLRP
jgi:hypothetical protein